MAALRDGLPPELILGVQVPTFPSWSGRRDSFGINAPRIVAEGASGRGSLVKRPAFKQIVGCGRERKARALHHLGR